MADLTKEELKTQLADAVEKLFLSEDNLQKTSALNVTLTTENKKLTEENTDAATANKKLKANIAVLEQESQAKDTIITALEAELATSKSQATGAPKTATLGDKKYRVTIPAIRHKGNIVTAQDILGNEDLLAELVAKGSGAIEEVTEAQ